MTNKIAIITGANSGIGLASTIQMVEKGIHVIMTCRHEGRAIKALEEVTKETGLNNVEWMLLDLASQKSIYEFVKNYKKKFDKLDILINNAGSFNIAQKKINMTEDDFESLWAINYLGPFLLTNLLMDLMEGNKGRIINISSKGLLVYPFMKIDYNRISNANRKFKVQKEYYHAKLAHLMFTYKLADRLTKSDVNANAIRVPTVKISEERLLSWGVSKLMIKILSMKTKNALSPKEMAITYVKLALDDEYNDLNGQYLDEKLCSVGSNKYSLKFENQEKLWEESVKMVNL